MGDELKKFSSTVYKVRIGSTDQNKGKRGGFRLVYIVIRKADIVYLMAIYAKAQKEDLTQKEEKQIKDFIKELGRD